MSETENLTVPTYYSAIDWNSIEDSIDKYTWEKLTSQFWLDTRVPVSNDLDDWRKLPQLERDTFAKAFAGLTLLDTLQSVDGAEVLKHDARTPQEIACFNNIQFMESVHAKSYSTIFSTLNTKRKLKNSLTGWIPMSICRQRLKSSIRFMNLAPLFKRKWLLYFLSFCLFYSGFYTPLLYLGNNKMINSAEIIKLIIRDESVHGTYIGYKFQLGFNELSEDEQSEFRDWMYELLYKLYENEENYSHLLYDKVGWTDEVLTFLRYNANKALMNLGQDPLFPDTAADVNPVVMNGISTSSSNHDFFSQVGNSYLLGEVEAMSDEDYDI